MSVGQGPQKGHRNAVSTHESGKTDSPLFDWTLLHLPTCQDFHTKAKWLPNHLQGRSLMRWPAFQINAYFDLIWHPTRSGKPKRTSLLIGRVEIHSIIHILLVTLYILKYTKYGYLSAHKYIVNVTETNFKSVRWC